MASLNGKGETQMGGMPRIQVTSSLQTEKSIGSDLRRLGVRAGQVLMVHSSLSSIGYVVGGAPTVVRALIDVLGVHGTLVMPAFSPEVSDPVTWKDRSFDDDVIELVRQNLPVFDLAVTPTSMGTIAETFRTWPDVMRSEHPQVSVTARGPLARLIVSPHELSWGQGAGSPFARLYDFDAGLLLLGVGFNRATLLHFAESRVPHGRRKVRRIPVDASNNRVWVSAPDVGDDLNRYFPLIGEQFMQLGQAQVGTVGRANCTLTSARAIVDFAIDFLSKALDPNAVSR
jgi:aminoglycoside 3-N-acetyltransferase